MTKSMYVGISGTARKVKKFYVGVSGTARTVKKAYVGVNGVARLFYTSDFWLPGGLAASACLAAYQFKGAASASAARTDLTGHGYTLTESNSPTWTSANGYYFGSGAYLGNSTLNALKTVKTIVIRYSGLSTATAARLPLSLIKGQTTAGTSNPLLWARPNFRIIYNTAETMISSSYPCIVTALNTSTNKLTYKLGSAKAPATGVLACDASNIYLNGTAQTLTSHTVNCDSSITTESNIHTQYSYTLASNSSYPYYVIAAAFYNVTLSATQHKEVADAMLSI